MPRRAVARISLVFSEDLPCVADDVDLLVGPQPLGQRQGLVVRAAFLQKGHSHLAGRPLALSTVSPAAAAWPPWEAEGGGREWESSFLGFSAEGLRKFFQPRGQVGPVPSPVAHPQVPAPRLPRRQTGCEPARGVSPPSRPRAPLGSGKGRGGSREDVVVPALRVVQGKDPLPHLRPLPLPHERLRASAGLDGLARPVRLRPSVGRRCCRRSSAPDGGAPPWLLTAWRPARHPEEPTPRQWPATESTRQGLHPGYSRSP